MATMEQETQVEIEKLLKEVDQAKKNHEKRLKNIKQYTSWAKVVCDRQVLETQAKEQCDELVDSLMQKIKLLKDGLFEEQQSRKRKCIQTTKCVSNKSDKSITNQNSDSESVESNEDDEISSLGDSTKTE